MENKEKMIKIFRTKCLATASALLSSDQIFLELEKHENCYHFCFDDKYGKCENLANQHLNGRLKVISKRYSDATRALKDLLFAKKY